MSHSIQLADVHVRLNAQWVLRGVDLEATAGEFVSIVGANGAGKTTLLRIMNGWVWPDRGRVSILGVDLSGTNGLDALRRRIGVVLQRSQVHRFPIRVEEAVLMGRFGKIGVMRGPSAADVEKMKEALEIMGIGSLARKLVGELSGGEQQKVALARCLAQEPEILLLDEPTTYLDSASRPEIMETLRKIHRERGWTTVMVSHESRWVEHYSDRIYLLEEGRSRLIRDET